MTDPAVATSTHRQPPPDPSVLRGAAGYADIDLGAITDNVATLKGMVGDAEVLAVVKADGYGHGALPSARAALAGGATWLGVAQLTEALAVRAAGITAPILTWLWVPGGDLDAAILTDIDITASSVDQLTAITETASGRGKSARVQLKVDTGLGRNGAVDGGWSDLVHAAARAQAEGAVRITGVWSHFAYADAPQHPTVRLQQERFVAAVAQLERAGVRPDLRHLANSAATLTNPSAHFDLVRPGLAVYGLSPVPDLGPPEHWGLREAMRLIARLALVKDVPAGQGVSYAHAYTTSQRTKLGLVPLGYADGIPRAGSNVGPVLVGGERHTVAGRVCMDQFMIDLGPDSEAMPGDDVVILGRSVDDEPTAEDWAAATGTISYEIVTRISGRLPRVYRSGP